MRSTLILKSKVVIYFSDQSEGRAAGVRTSSGVFIYMRNWILLILAFIVGAGLLACNSNETLLSQTPKPPNQTAPTPPPDNARRITVIDLHKLWENNEVLIIDTRAESAFKDEHIKGAISVPAGTLTSKFADLPRDKMIAAYCT